MKTISLTQGKEALVDDSDFVRLSKFKWYAYKSRGVWYAGRTLYRLDKTSYILQMHVLIIGKIEGLEIDHINRNGLDNRRSNLRHVTHSINCRNRRKLSKASSKHIGVSWDGKLGKWRAYIKVNQNLIHLGLYLSEKAALKRRQNAELIYFK